MSTKVAMIGAGSIVFCKTLMSDIMATPALAGCEFALMSRTEPKLRAMEAFGQRMLRDNGLPGSVWATLDRREAIRDADFVVVMIQVGGLEMFEHDVMIPRRYGIDLSEVVRGAIDDVRDDPAGGSAGAGALGVKLGAGFPAIVGGGATGDDLGGPKLIPSEVPKSCRALNTLPAVFASTPMPCFFVILASPSSYMSLLRRSASDSFLRASAPAEIGSRESSLCQWRAGLAGFQNEVETPLT